MCNFFNGRSTVEQSPSNRSQLYLTPSRSLTVVNSLRTRTRFTARQSFPPARTPAQAQTDRATPGCRGRRAVEGAAGSIQIEDEQHADANKTQLRRLRVTPSAQTKSTAAGHVVSSASCMCPCPCPVRPASNPRVISMASKAGGDSLANCEAAEAQHFSTVRLRH